MCCRQIWERAYDGARLCRVAGQCGEMVATTSVALDRLRERTSFGSICAPTTHTLPHCVTRLPMAVEAMGVNSRPRRLCALGWLRYMSIVCTDKAAFLSIHPRAQCYRLDPPHPPTSKKVRLRDTRNAVGRFSPQLLYSPPLYITLFFCLK